jgi:hypothetical protein
MSGLSYSSTLKFCKVISTFESGAHDKASRNLVNTDGACWEGEIKKKKNLKHYSIDILFVPLLTFRVHCSHIQGISLFQYGLSLHFL